MGQRRRTARLGPAVLLGVLLVVFAVRLVDAARLDAFTIDEPNYVGTGLYLWQSGDYHYVRSLRFHPPGVFHLASLPLLAFDLGDVPVGPDLGQRLLHGDELPVPRLRLASRLPFVALACWGAFLCFAWAREVAGDTAGLLAAFLYTASPSLLAHGHLAHSDIAITVLFLQTLYAFWRWLRRPTTLRLVACGVSLGLAMLAKLTSILLPGILALTLALALWPRRAGHPGLPAPLPEAGADEPAGAALRLRVATRAGAVLGACALGVLWLGYGGSFAWAERAEPPLAGVPLPAWVQSFLFVDQVNSAGRPVYFLGELATGGFAGFYPVAFALKEPLAGIALALAGLASLAPPWRRRGRLGLFLLPAFAVYLYVLVVWNEVPLGYRYALPLLPLLFVFTATQLAPVRTRAARVALLGACAVLAAEGLWVHPHYLAYFNAGAGGPAHGADYLLDANLDWGQDVTTLARALERRGQPPVWLALYGVEDPRTYGVRGRPLRGCRPVGGWLAISANVRKGLYAAHNPLAPPRPGCYAWLDRHEPVARPGGSIWLYRLPDPDAP